MKVYIILTLTAVAMAFATGYFSLSFMEQGHTPSAEDIIKIGQLKMRFQAYVKPISIVNLNSIYYLPDQFDLIDPFQSSIKAQDARKKARKIWKQDCFKNVPGLLNTHNFEKTWLFEEVRCGIRRELGPYFFKRPPFIHPSGLSFAYLAYINIGKGYNWEWAQEHLPYFHLKEIKQLNLDRTHVGREYKLLLSLDAPALRMILAKKGTILTKKYLLARIRYKDGPNILIYRVYARDRLDNYLKNTQYVIHNYRPGQSCFFKDGEICWEYNSRHLFQMMNKTTIIFFVISVLIIILVVYLLLAKIKGQKRDEERKRLALQVLTHEFRTPITSLLLIIDQMKKQFDQYPEESQEQFLRLSEEIYRLQRLVKTSRHYLRAQNDHKIIFAEVSFIESINSYFGHLVNVTKEAHPDSQIEFHPIKEDIGYKFDPYWIGICFKNLLENALNHGEQPVVVRPYLIKKKLCVEVEDQGSCDFEVLQDMAHEFVKGNKSTGSGLGLNIVCKVMKDLGGELIFERDPTRFTLVIKGQIN